MKKDSRFGCTIQIVVVGAPLNFETILKALILQKGKSTILFIGYRFIYWKFMLSAVVARKSIIAKMVCQFGPKRLK